MGENDVYAGVDGGGSKTKVIIIDGEGNQIAEAVGGPSSYRSVGFEQAVNTVAETIISALDALGKSRTLRGIFAGLGDIVSKQDQDRFSEALKKTLGFTLPVVVKNDVYAAFYGALDQASGVIIILGTGSVAFGIDEAGKTHRSGGYTFKEGDPGSAYDLGKQALSCIGKALDGRLAMTPFVEALMDTMQVHNRETVSVMYETMFGKRRETAQLAKLVTRFADQGDAHAMKICKSASQEAAEMVFGVDRHIALKNRELGIIGSLGNADTYYRKQFEEALSKHNNKWLIHPPKHDPALGAARHTLKLFRT